MSVAALAVTAALAAPNNIAAGSWQQAARETVSQKPGGESDAPSLFFHDESMRVLMRDAVTLPHFAHCKIWAGKISPCNTSATEARLGVWQQRLRAATLPDLAALASSYSERRPRWHTCSVVGGSGSLMNRSQGALIDSADAVIRVNEAPRDGPDACVAGTWPGSCGGRAAVVADAGSRTTLRVSTAFMRARVSKTRDPTDALRVVYCQPLTYLSNCWHALSNAAARPGAREAAPAYARLSPRLYADAQVACAIGWRARWPLSFRAERPPSPRPGARLSRGGAAARLGAQDGVDRRDRRAPRAASVRRGGALWVRLG
jgi:hypothetical protein